MVRYYLLNDEFTKKLSHPPVFFYRGWDLVQQASTRSQVGQVIQSERQRKLMSKKRIQTLGQEIPPRRVLAGRYRKGAIFCKRQWKHKEFY